jgi:hypothetical protein
MQEAIIANLKYLWSLIDAAACRGAHVEVNGYLHEIRLVELFGISVCAVLGVVTLKCIEHGTQ